MKLSFTISTDAISVLLNGRPRIFRDTHPNFAALREACLMGDEELIEELADVRTSVAKRSYGRVQILDNAITVDGREVSGRLVDRILEMVSLGATAIEGYVRFLDNLYDNPSKRAVDELYLFIEACNLPITEDGHFLAYKKVRGNYTDIHSGTFDNSVGSVPTVPRNTVDENRDVTCSTGLHFCSYSYLPHFGWGDDNRVMVVKVNPADVVSIPSDYDNAKGRTCRYEVVDELEDWRETELEAWFTEQHGSVDEPADEPVEEDDAPSNTTRQKLNENQVRDIKRVWGPKIRNSEVTLTAVGKMFDVHRETIARILRGDIWADIS